MNNTPSNGYDPVTNYMEQYGNSVSYDPETKQYVSNDQTSQPASAQTVSPAAAPQAAAPQYAPAQPQYPAPTFVAPPVNVSAARRDPLDNTVQTSEARKPFRKLSSRVGVSLILYLVFDFFFGYLLIYTPYLLNLKNALANTNASELFSERKYGEAYWTVIVYVQSILSESTLTAWHLAAVIIGAIIASILPMLILAKQNDFKAFSVFRKGKKYGNGLTIKCVCAAFAVTIIWSLIYQILSLLFPPVGNSEMGMDMPDTIVGMCLYIAYVVIGAPLLEEFIFRGVMLKALTPYGTLFASMVTALLFGLLHGNLQQTPFAFGVGLILAYAAIKTGSIRTGILIHFIVNFLSTASQLVYNYCSENITKLFSMLVLFVYGASVITTIVVLLIDGIKGRISFIQEPEDGNNIVLPVKSEQPNLKFLHCFTSLGMVIFLIYIIFDIIASMGVFS